MGLNPKKILNFSGIIFGKIFASPTVFNLEQNFAEMAKIFLLGK